MSTWSFHANCGKNIQLSAEVKDRNDMNNRVVISSESMISNIVYKIQVEERAEVNGQGRAQICTAFGVCLDNSSSLILLPMCTDIETFVGVNNSGTCVIPNHCLIDQAQTCPGLSVQTINESNSLGVMVDESDFLHVYLNDEDQGVVAKISTEFRYAVFDLQDSLMSTWSFHAKCGKNIQFLSAKVKDRNDRGSRVVISSEEMSPKTLYEITMEEKDELQNNQQPVFGVCHFDPSSTLLPLDCNKIPTFVGVFTHGLIDIPEPNSSFRSKWLSRPEEETVRGSTRLGVMVDDSRSLHLYVDGNELRKLENNCVGPCFATFYLNVSLKISTLPLSSVEPPVPQQ